MDRESWAEFLEKRLSTRKEEWPAPPPIPGDWRPLEGDDAALVLLDFTQEQLAAEQRPVCESFPALLVRAVPLQCYEGHLLCEALLDTPEGRGIVSFVYGPSGVWELTMQSAVLHRMNATIGAPATTRETAGQYLRLFCAFTMGGAESGRFQIVEMPEQILVDEHLAETPEAALESSLEPVSIERMEPAPEASVEEPAEAEDDDAYSPQNYKPVWKASAMVLYGTTLFKAGFDLDEKGMVRMTEDTPAQEDMPVRIERYINTVRLP